MLFNGSYMKQGPSSMRVRFLALAVMAIGTACGSDDSSSAHPADAGVDGDAEESDAPASAEGWHQLAPATGGFVSAVAFRPGQDGELWISGDDGSGVYRRKNGGEFDAVSQAPVDWSAYALAFDLNEPDTFYVPNHFGRGLARSDDGGASWQVLEHDVLWGAAWNDLVALDKGGATRLVAATSTGLLKSDDRGGSLVTITSPSFTETESFGALAVGPDGTVYAGNDRGGVYVSKDMGDTWTSLVPAEAEGIPVTDLAVTAHALYVGYALGFVARTRQFSALDFALLDTGARIGSSLWTKLAVVQGETPEKDVLWVGTVAPAFEGEHGLFVSRDGGATFTGPAAIEGASVFDLAVDPTAPDHVVVTSVNGKVYESEDDGVTWRDASAGVVAWDSLGVAQAADAPEHLAFASTTGLPGNGRILESTDGAASWTVVEPPAEPYGLWLGDQKLIMGTFRDQGLFVRDAGAWKQVLDIGVGFRQILQDPADTSRFVAVSSENSTDWSDAGVYESVDGAETWQRLSATPAFVAEFPTGGGDVYLGATDVLVIASGGGSTSLGLTTVLDTDDYVTGLSLDDKTVLVGTLLGHVWVSEDCSAANAPCAWSRVQAPVHDGLVNVVAGTPSAPHTWFVSSVAADLGVRATSTNGVWSSMDRGKTWVRADEGLYPCRMIWRMQRDASGGLLAGLWGGGFAGLGLE